MNKRILFGFVLLILGISFADTVSAELLKSESVTLQISQRHFCENIQAKIDTLESLKEAYYNFYQKQSDSLQAGYNDEICKSSSSLYVDTCHAWRETKTYQSRICEGDPLVVDSDECETGDANCPSSDGTNPTAADSN